VCSRLSKKLYIGLKNLNWKLIITPNNLFAKGVAIAFSLKKFILIEEPNAIIPGNTKKPSYGFDIRLKDKNSKIICSIGSVHLNYDDENAAFKIYEYQLNKIKQGIISILGGDANVPANDEKHNMYGLIGNYHFSSNIDKQDNQMITDIDERDGKVKRYDGFFLSPQNSNLRIYAHELPRDYWVIKKGELSIKRLDENVLNQHGEPVLKHRYESLEGIPWIKR